MDKEKSICECECECECECTRKTHRDGNDRKKLINRLARIEGQIRGIKGMLENDAYCTDVLIQSSAVSAAINAFNRELIGEHIKGCVVRDIKNGNEEVVDELISLLSRLMK